MAEAETVIEIKADPPPETTEVVVDAKKAPKTEQKIITADEGVDDLKAQVERAKAESQRRLQEADRQIAAARQRAIDAENETAVVKTGAVSTVIDSLMKDKDAAKRDYRAAMEAGDYEKSADAQDRLALANARLVEAERGKMELEAQAKTPRRAAEQPVFQDSVETVARAMGSQRSADWVRRHPEHVVNGALSPKVLSAHYSAVDNGHAPDSEEYFAYVDRSLGGARAASAQQETLRAPTAAPVARDVAQSPGAPRPGTVRLTQSQARTAVETLSPLYPNASKEELYRMYAKNREDLISEGRVAS